MFTWLSKIVRTSASPTRRHTVQEATETSSIITCSITNRAMCWTTFDRLSKKERKVFFKMSFNTHHSVTSLHVYSVSKTSYLRRQMCSGSKKQERALRNKRELWKAASDDLLNWILSFSTKELIISDKWYIKKCIFSAQEISNSDTLWCPFAL